MQNFQDTFDTRKRLFTSAFSICMTVPLVLKFTVVLEKFKTVFGLSLKL